MDSSTDTILLNGTAYPLDQLPDSFASLNAFEQSTLQFCVDWKSGNQEFTVTTSGSTSKPRPIVIHRSQMIRSAHHTAAALRLTRSMTALVCLDTKYIAGMMMLVRGIELGMNVIAVNPTANPFAQLNGNVDFTALTPYQLQTILDSSAKEHLNELQSIIIGGAPLSSDTIKKLSDLKSDCYATYGMTETVSHIALQKLNGLYSSTNFKALPGVSLSLDDRECLVIEADFVENGKVITNDIVSLHSKDEFTWVGRWDNVINSGGIKIHPEQIEQAITQVFASLHLNNRFFIGAIPDSLLGQKMILVIEGEDQNSFQLAREQLKLRLDPYKNPKEWIFVEAFAETETGKINRTETMKKIPNQAPPKGGA